MKFLILAENTNYKCDCWPYLHFRGLESYEIRKRLEQRSIQSTIIEWFTHWGKDQLGHCINSWFSNEEYPVIAISTPYAQNDIHRIQSVLQQAKKQYPNLKIIHTGSRTYNDTLKDIVDVFFLSRSMEMFEDWLDNKDLSLYKKHNSPLVLVNDFVKDAVDNPILPTLNSSDCLSSKDIIGFELGIGCRFNCSFCNYELRNIKTSNLTTSKDLSDFLEQCYQQYGITNFYTADDTINESDEKLIILAEAVEQLSFKPKISCFVRLDVLTARPHQMDLLERIQFFSIFFGIESFNENASKQVRKKSSIGNVYATLEELKHRCPETFTVGGLIVGLNGDSRESIINSIELVIKNQLLDSIQAYPLSITKATSVADKGFQSDIDTDPDKFNYKTQKIEGLLYRDNPSTEVYDWQSDWTDANGASILCGEVLNMCHGKVFDFNHWEYLRASSLGLVQNKNVPVSWKDHCQHLSEKFKKNYITEKLKQFK